MEGFQVFDTDKDGIVDKTGVTSILRAFGDWKDSELDILYEMSNCTLATDKGVKVLTLHCPNLTKVVLTKTAITDEGVKTLLQQHER